MTTKELTILNKEGFHARPAQLWVQTASKFESSIKVKKDDMEADGKSMLGLMTLELTKGTTVTIEADGPDEEAAVKALEELVASKFGEE